MKPRISSIITAIAYIVISGMFVYTAPRFGAIYAELYEGKVPLPFLTRIVLMLAPIGWILLGIGPALFLVFKDVRTTSRKIANWPFVVALVLVAIAGIISLFLPLSRMGGGLSASQS